MPDRTTATIDTTRDLRTALAGTRALLLDLDGVIVVAGDAVPGAPEAIAALEARRSRTGS